MMDARNVLQIVTINIGGNKHLCEAPLDPHRIAEEVQEILPVDPDQPTIIAMQEVSRIWYREDHMLDTGALLAARLSPAFRSYYGADVDSLTHPWKGAWGKSAYEGAVRASEGNSIITNVPTANWPWLLSSPGYPGHGSTDPLSTLISGATLYSTGDRDTQPRGLLVTSLDTPMGPIFFMATHLTTLNGEEHDHPDPGLYQASRERFSQVKQILAVVRELRSAERANNTDPRPIILAGDFNAQPSSSEMQALGCVFDLLKPDSGNGDLSTHIRHQIQVDHIFLCDPFGTMGKPTDCFIHQGDQVSRVTDHLPVVAIFKSKDRVTTTIRTETSARQWNYVTAA